MSTLYVVATPIGNLEDITLRALRVLEEVDYVLCEDTRVTKKLLSRYNLKTPTLSYHAHSSHKKEEKIIGLLKEGLDLALVTDAGTPAVSDPGGGLVNMVRKVLPEVSIVAIPGASALAAALSVAGVSVSDFVFLGFPPHKKGREKLFKEMAASKRTVMFYESTHRILKALTILDKLLSGERKIIIARELTKIHEEVISGTASELLFFFTEHPKKQKGEFVVILEAK